MRKVMLIAVPAIAVMLVESLSPAAGAVDIGPGPGPEEGEEVPANGDGPHDPDDPGNPVQPGPAIGK